MEFYYRLARGSPEGSPQTYSQFEEFSSDFSQDRSLKIDAATLDNICK